MSDLLRNLKSYRVIAMAVLLTAGTLVGADATEPDGKPAPMALTGIMQDLSTDMQGVTDAIAREDWPAVAKLAARIADHPQPPLAEKLRILAFAGKDASRFRSYDQQAHQAARWLAQAAQQRDGTAAIAAFAKVQGACMACHQNFRQRFQQHFHGQP
ncbi:MAG TPA: cytochrome c [Rhodanobacter sp.]|nr:cytochrome c [Rhodanobacter sp.]